MIAHYCQTEQILHDENVCFRGVLSFDDAPFMGRYALVGLNKR